MNEETIFAEARRRPTPAERDEYLKQACGDNAVLRERVAALVAADQAHDSLLDEPLLRQGDTVDLPSTIQKPGDQVGDYKLLQQIGEGGFGVVFMAEQQRPITRRVALKIIKPGMDSREVIARFEAERQALAMMDHPNIAKVLGAGTTGQGRPYFVMELVRGIRITQFCDDQQLTPRERLELFIPVCHAIQHAHQKGIIHRDIKPSNILVSLYDGRPVPKVIDFGVAKAIQQRLTERTMFTQFGQVMGTLEYMSPEQAEMNQLDIDTRADIYSLGAVLYELLTGSPPFERKRLRSGAFDQILRIIREEEPPRPSMRLSASESLPTISAQRKMEPARLPRLMRGEIDWIVMKALDKQRSRRYETANAMAADINAHLNGLSVSAVAPSTAYRVQKYVRRHSAALAVAAAIVGLLLAGTIVSTILARQAIVARALAETKEREANEERRRAEREKAAAVVAEQQAERLAYARAMQVALSDLERGSMRRLEQTLADTSSYSDRRFEWYYLQDQLHRVRLTINPQLGSIWGVRRASDQGNIIVDTDTHRSYRLDVKTGNVVGAFGTGLPSPDGRWIAERVYGENDPTVTVTDTTTGMRTTVQLPETQRVAALSPDGVRLIAIDSANWTALHVWDVKTAKHLNEIKPLPQARFIDVQYSPNGQWLACSVSHEKWSETELRRASDGQLIPSSEAIRGHVFSFTADSLHLARWDGTTGQIRFHSTKDLSDVMQIPYEQQPSGMAFSPEGTYIAFVNGYNDAVVIYEVQSRRKISTYRVNGISGITFSHDGKELIAAAHDGSIKFFPVESGDYIPTEPHLMVQFSADGNRLLTKNIDGRTSQLIDVASRTVLTDYPHVSAAAIFPNGRRVVTAANSSVSEKHGSAEITIANDHGEKIRQFYYNDFVTDLEVATGGHRLLVAELGSCSLLDAETGETIFERRHGNSRFVGGFLPDGKQFALWFQGEPLQFYDAATGSPTGNSILFEPEPELKWLTFSPDGTRVATPYEDTADSIYGVAIYDLATKQQLTTITGHARHVHVAHFLPPDGRRLVTKSGDGTVRLWDVESGFELLSLRDEAYNETLLGLAVSPADGGIIAISGAISGGEAVFLKKAATPEQVAAWKPPPKMARDTQWWSRLGGAQDWLVLAPFELRPQEYLEDLAKQQLPDEADLDPTPGVVVPVGEEKLIWKPASTNDCVLDLHNEISPDQDHCLAYAVTHIYSDEPREGVRLLFGSDDLAKVYLNGKKVHECRKRRAAVPADDEVLINLRKGKNVLVCKVIDDQQAWGVSAQIVGDDYKPIPGVTTGIRP